MTFLGNTNDHFSQRDENSQEKIHSYGENSNLGNYFRYSQPLNRASIGSKNIDAQFSLPTLDLATLDLEVDCTLW